MDFNSLKDAVTNLTLYDLKAGVRKVQNAVMNFTEMEAKVREATNNEPWGASTTIMQEIANGTFNYQTLNEIMPMIYRRFTEKSAEEWRQIYKALQLLEFLIKHGSERVVDDARSHITILKMLRQFAFIDANGKDQGINVRNRAKELTDLLSDVERIRSERKKAKSNRAKYTGVEGGGGLGGGGSSSSGRYGGFGSESSGYGGYSGGVYGDGGGFGGQEDQFRGSSAGGGRDKFEEYDEYDEGAAPPPAGEGSSSSASRSKRPAGSSSSKKAAAAAAAAPTKPKEPAVDLFSFDDPIPATLGRAPSVFSPLAAPPTAPDDDEFDDFQSATPAATANKPVSSLPPPMTTSTAAGAAFAAPKPVSAPQQAGVASLVGFASLSPAPSSSASTPAPSAFSSFGAPPAAAAPKPSAYQAAAPNYYQSVPLAPAVAAPAQGMGMMGAATTSAPAVGPQPAKKSGGDAFGSLWAAASAGSGSAAKPNTPGPAMVQLAKEKSAAGIWGAPAAAPKPMGMQQQQKQPALGNGLDDLLS